MALWNLEGIIGIYWAFQGYRGTWHQKGTLAMGCVVETQGPTTHRSSSISSFRVCASWARLVSAWFRCCSSATSRSNSMHRR